MENEDSVDVVSNDVTYSDTAEAELSDHEDDSEAKSSGCESSDDSYDSEDGDDSDGDDSDDDDDADDSAGVNAEVNAGDRMVRINSITADEIVALEFSTVEEAYDFYYRYGKCKGFSIRKHDRRYGGPKSNRKLLMRQFVCSKHGLREKKHLCRLDRKREHRRLTRTDCKARLRVKYKAKKGTYVVSIFVEGHNHELTPSKYVHLHPVFRKISESDKAQIDGLQSHGIRTCHIMGYMVAQKGGYDGVGFTKKDLYNYFDKKMRDITKDGDVEASLNYLNVKSGTDPMLYAKYDADSSNGRMKSLYWADGISRSDYFCFGDVVAFDTTYKKNKYNYPLVIFSGCNHHGQTVIFATALVADETIDTYKWVLSCFLHCMENKHPKAVLTDGDGAMREAIKQVFPHSTHRLCA
jgi:zinc finger SWIM domain-containing protein 3